MKLISLSDFVLEKNEFGLFKKNDEQIRKYAEFLQQDLVLSMFLPCDSNGVFCPNPNLENFSIDEKGSHLFNLALTKWKQGLEKVIFNPVTFCTVKGQEGARFYSVGETQVFNLSEDGTHLYWHHYTIESLLTEMDETIEYVGFF